MIVTVPRDANRRPLECRGLTSPKVTAQAPANNWGVVPWEIVMSLQPRGLMKTHAPKTVSIKPTIVIHKRDASRHLLESRVPIVLKAIAPRRGLVSKRVVTHHWACVRLLQLPGKTAPHVLAVVPTRTTSVTVVPGVQRHLKGFKDSTLTRAPVLLHVYKRGVTQLVPLGAAQQPRVCTRTKVHARLSATLMFLLTATVLAISVNKCQVPQVRTSSAAHVKQVVNKTFICQVFVQWSLWKSETRFFYCSKLTPISSLRGPMHQVHLPQETCLLKSRLKLTERQKTHWQHTRKL